MFQIKYGVALIALAYAGASLADDVPEFNGDDVVVTASGVPQARGIAPVSVSVISAQDIANSSATTVQDVLATAAGVHVYSAGASSPVVDLGGFGQTGFSNTLILVDGVKQNTNDQSAPNLGYIPLASIERIEIVRRSGAVQYGDGATGGVINIITKSGYRAENHASITQTVGSFNLRQTDASFNLAGERISLDGFAQSMNTDHARDNSAERRDGGGLGVNWKLDDGAVRLYAKTSSDSQGMAGGRDVNLLTGVSEFNSNPSGTTTPFDHGTVKSNTIGLQAQNKLGIGRLYFDLATRDKKTTSHWVGSGYDSLGSRTLNEDSGSVRYVLPFARTNQWLFGYDWLSGDANFSSDGQTTSSSKQRHQALFTEGQLDLWSGARATIGGRVQRIDDHKWGSSLNLNSGKELHAWQLGLRQALGSTWSVYAKQGQSFRLPNSDDFGATTTAGVLPQTSRDQELGVEWSQGASNAHVAVFRSDVTNEIHFLPFVAATSGWSGANINLSPTRHQGVEFEGKAALNSAFSVYGNLTWQQATFRSGTYSGINLSGNAIPMVPSWLANLGVSWAATEQTRLNLEAQYVGAQHLDNDQSNQYVTQLAAYTVLNTKLSHQFSKSISGTFSINNLLDRHYATYGIEYSSFYTLYPGDPRNYQASLTWAF
jgi:iron complex outermembrane receptor protein